LEGRGAPELGAMLERSHETHQEPPRRERARVIVRCCRGGAKDEYTRDAATIRDAVGDAATIHGEAGNNNNNNNAYAKRSDDNGSAQCRMWRPGRNQHAGRLGVSPWIGLQ